MQQKSPPRQIVLKTGGTRTFYSNLTQIQEARLHHLNAREFFSSKGMVLKEGKKTPDSALTACFIGISAWMKVERESWDNAEKIEANMKLGELFSMRGMVCKKKYEQLALAGKDPLFWLVRAGEAFENSLSHYGRAPFSLKKDRMNAHEEASYAFNCASSYLYTKNPCPFPQPSKATLLAQPGEIGKYAKLAEFHRMNSSRLFLELNPDIGK